MAMSHVRRDGGSGGANGMAGHPPSRALRIGWQAPGKFARASSAGSQETHRIRCHTRAVTATKLLLVDDEDNLRSMLEAALRHSGFEVHPVANGRDAIDAVATVQPDLVVLDVMLPDLDGFDVCKRLRSSGDRTPVLFLTARDATEDRVRGLTLGGDDYLVKPFSLEELVARITAVLRRAGVDRDDDRAALRRPGDGRRRPRGHPRRRGGAPSRPPSTTCCATC